MSPNSLVRVWGAFGAPSVSFSFLFHRTQAMVMILERLYSQRYCAMNGFGHAAPLWIPWLLEIEMLESRNATGIPRRE
jgi:ABC-type sulfate transport system permease subunit